ncbi:MAG: hypothetical protein K2X47_19835, partial [Bdellovibrionales bacterium]|nr:hypothetical protein [Bdellovibrionales bacterium]
MKNLMLFKITLAFVGSLHSASAASGADLEPPVSFCSKVSIGDQASTGEAEIAPPIEGAPSQVDLEVEKRIGKLWQSVGPMITVGAVPQTTLANFILPETQKKIEEISRFNRTKWASEDPTNSSSEIQSEVAEVYRRAETFRSKREKWYVREKSKKTEAVGLIQNIRSVESKLEAISAKTQELEKIHKSVQEKILVLDAELDYVNRLIEKLVLLPPLGQGASLHDVVIPALVSKSTDIAGLRVLMLTTVHDIESRLLVYFHSADEIRKLRDLAVPLLVAFDP